MLSDSKSDQPVTRPAAQWRTLAYAMTTKVLTALLRDMRTAGYEVERDGAAGTAIARAPGGGAQVLRALQTGRGSTWIVRADPRVVAPAPTCPVCGAESRERGNGCENLCEACYDEAGLENEHSDYGHPQRVPGCPTCAAEPEGGA